MHREHQEISRIRELWTRTRLYVHLHNHMRSSIFFNLFFNYLPYFRKLKSFLGTHQVVLFWDFEQHGFTVTVVGENDIQVALVAQIEAAEGWPRSVKDLQPPLVVDLHADRKQRFLMALPFKRWRRDSKEQEEVGFWMILDRLTQHKSWKVHLTAMTGLLKASVIITFGHCT